ncbi:MAG: class I SAM-dependent methyltransferase [Deltaproteobacteria bacterium]|nr:class I SAM-dependent methyltransferase [Deltaproteobacteria bacterium]
MPLVILKPGRDKSLLRRHPWVFSGALKKVEGDPGPGEVVEVLSHEGRFLCRASYSPYSQIALRAWTFDSGEEVGPEFFRSRLKQAIDFRAPLLKLSDGACRLVNAESDGLPGVIVDKYAAFLVCQFFSAGAELWRGEILSHLEHALSPLGIYERSDVDVRLKEGLEPRSGLLWGQPPPSLLVIREKNCRFLVDIEHGQKTGCYLDQRENRVMPADYAEGAEVLNAFSYTGGFGIHALKAGAIKVTNIDSSPAALSLANQNRELNHFDEDSFENIHGDVFQVLRDFRDTRRLFDLIILDPPKFVESRSQLGRGSRGYKDINLLAFKLLKPGGVLFTFSCSGLVPLPLFQMIVAGAALDAGRNAQILGVLTQGPDHPTALNFPEGAYLKGLICRAY